MSKSGRSIECGNCHLILDEPPDLPPSKSKPCPNCGSLKRHVRSSFSEKLALHGKLKMKARSPEGGRPSYESTQGDDLHRKSGRWMKLRRIIDREKDRYLEMITDPRTGEIVHKCEEPLSEHRGHGSAKKEGKEKQTDDA